MSVYSRAHLVDIMRRRARTHLSQARFWREESSAPMSYYRVHQCRAYARQELDWAGAYRRRLLVFRNEPGRFVTKERYGQIMRGEW